MLKLRVMYAIHIGSRDDNIAARVFVWTVTAVRSPTKDSPVDTSSPREQGDQSRCNNGYTIKK